MIVLFKLFPILLVIALHPSVNIISLISSVLFTSCLDPFFVLFHVLFIIFAQALFANRGKFIPFILALSVMEILRRVWLLFMALIAFFHGWDNVFLGRFLRSFDISSSFGAFFAFALEMIVGGFVRCKINISGWFKLFATRAAFLREVDIRGYNGIHSKTHFLVIRPPAIDSSAGVKPIFRWVNYTTGELAWLFYGPLSRLAHPDNVCYTSRNDCLTHANGDNRKSRYPVKIEIAGSTPVIRATIKYAADYQRSN